MQVSPMLPQVFKEQELRLYCTLNENYPNYHAVREEGQRYMCTSWALQWYNLCTHTITFCPCQCSRFKTWCDANGMVWQFVTNVKLSTYCDSVTFFVKHNRSYETGNHNRRYPTAREIWASDFMKHIIINVHNGRIYVCF